MENMLDDFDPQQEHLLVRRAVHDPTAFQSLYELYFKRVYSYVAAKVSNHLDAEDLVSDTFLQVVKGLPQFKSHHNSSFGAWIFTIARNLVTDFYRRQGRAVDTHQLDALKNDVADPIEVDGHLLEQERAAGLHTMLKKLPERRREVMMLKYFSGLRNQQIAQVLDLDERTVASHLSRGLKDLNEFYATRLESDEGAVHDEQG
jgi:RNA polymerase sigma-70 factor (ECF subfamily)